MAKHSAAVASMVMVWVADSAMACILLHLGVVGGIGFVTVGIGGGRRGSQARSERAVARRPDAVEAQPEHGDEYGEGGRGEGPHRRHRDGDDALHGQAAPQT